MTDATTIEPESDEDLESIRDDLTALVQNEPDHLFSMCQAVFAVHEIADLIGEHEDTGDARVVLRDLQKILIAHSVLDVRKPTLDEMADPDWWGHAEQVTSSDSIVCVSDEHADTLDALRGALEMDGETMQ